MYLSSDLETSAFMQLERSSYAVTSLLCDSDYYIIADLVPKCHYIGHFIRGKTMWFFLKKYLITIENEACGFWIHCKNSSTKPGCNQHLRRICQCEFMTNFNASKRSSQLKKIMNNNISKKNKSNDNSNNHLKRLLGMRHSMS